MGFFRRNRPSQPDDSPQEESLEEIEENPELLAAEAAVNELPPPPPTGPWIQEGATAEMVTFPGPGPDDDPANHEDADEAPPER